MFFFKGRIKYYVIHIIWWCFVCKSGSLQLNSEMLCNKYKRRFDNVYIPSGFTWKSCVSSTRPSIPDLLLFIPLLLTSSFAAVMITKTTRSSCLTTNVNMCHNKTLRTEAVFQAEVWQRVGTSDSVTATSPHIHFPFLPSYKFPKPLPATTLLSFGPVMLPCGLKCHLFWVGNLFSCQTVNAIRASHPCPTRLVYTHRQRSICLCHSSVTNSAGRSEVEQSVPLLHLSNLHTDLERECEWGLCVTVQCLLTIPIVLASWYTHSKEFGFNIT